MKLLFALLILLVNISGAFAKEDSAYDRVIEKNVIVCGLSPWAGWKVIDPITKEWSGFAVDIYRKAFSTIDLKVIFKEVVQGTQVQDLNSGKVDAICDDGPYVLSSGKYLEYSDPVMASLVYPYVRIDDNRFMSRSDLNSEQIKFTGMDGDLSLDLAHRLFPKAQVLSMPGTTNMSQLFVNVETKKADVVIIDPISFEEYNKNNPKKLKPLFKDKPVGRYKVVISVKKGDMKLLGLVNQAIDNAHAFGLIDEELEKADPKHESILRVRNPFTP